MKQKNIWKIFIHLSDFKKINIQGDGASLKVNNDDSYEVILKKRNYHHCLIQFKKNKLILFSTSGSQIPCYARIISDQLILSNIVDNVIISNENVSINSYVLFQNLTGQPYPQSNIFNDILSLSASGIYEIRNKKIIYKGTQLKNKNVANFEDAFEVIKNSFDSMMKCGCDVNILLSGGYDSRLNLLLAINAAKRFGNKIKTYHFFKDEHELSISKLIAKNTGVDFVYFMKNDFIENNVRLKFDKDFIRFHNGIYRDDLPRWHGLLEYITSNSGANCLTIGLGAEAHKGKYYKKFNNINDAEDVLGIDQQVVPEICRSLNLKSYNKDSQKIFFNELVKRSEIFDSLDQRIDFIHYHTYASNGWGCRTNSVSSYFSVPFSFISHDFLTKVFLLQRYEKEDFAITKKMIERLNPAMAKVPYVSGNAPSTKVGKNLKQKMKSLLPNMLTNEYSYVKNRFFQRKKRGRHNLKQDELDLIQSTQPKSSISALLKEILLNKSKFNSVPHIRYTYTLQAFLYLTFLEKSKNITLKLE